MSADVALAVNAQRWHTFRSGKPFTRVQVNQVMGFVAAGQYYDGKFAWIRVRPDEGLALDLCWYDFRTGAFFQDCGPISA